jgi:Na+/H+-translocating membrane pyrophosphatase
MMVAFLCLLPMYDIFVVLCSSPVQDVADSCRTGAATNVIFGLALGYKSVIIPIFAIAFSIFLSFSLAAMYGVAVAALGMLSTIATGLAIDAYGPISDNAGGIAEMAGMSHRIRERTDALDAAGNTTAAIGKVDYMLNLSEFHVIAHRTKVFFSFPRFFPLADAS